jgi:hypothetical protein
MVVSPERSGCSWTVSVLIPVPDQFKYLAAGTGTRFRGASMHWKLLAFVVSPPW